MPRYDYECPDCEHVFEVKQSYDDAPVADCPKCRTAAQRVFSPVPIIFKGSGFYITDQRETAKAGTAKSSQEGTEAKPEPGKSEPVKGESAKSEPGKSEPGKSEPAKTGSPKQGSTADASVS